LRFAHLGQGGAVDVAFISLNLPLDVIGPILEWTDAICIARYTFSAVMAFGKRCDESGIAIMAAPQEETEESLQMGLIQSTIGK